MNARALTLGLSLLLAACAGQAPEEAGRSAAALKGGTADTTAANVVGVVNTRPTFASICTGSLLAPNLVLVSRSCVSVLAGGGGTSCATSIFEAPAGSLDVYVDPVITVDAGARVHVDKVLVPTDDHVCGNDLALLVLSGTVASSVATPLIPRLDVPPTKGETYTAIGYGAVDGAGSDAGVRRRLTPLAVTCVDACDSIGATAGKEIGGAEGPCNGDNGSPAIDAAGKVFAISSRGPGACAAGLYTRLDAFAAFLKAGALEAATKGGYAAPGWATTPTDAGVDAASDAPTADATADATSDVAPGDAGSDTSALDDATPTPAAPAEEGGGCGCTQVGQTTPSSRLASALLLLALLVRRRSRSA